MNRIAREWRAFLLKHLKNYDAVIVSCRRYKESLLKAGFKGRVHQIYPHIDERAHRMASNSKVQRFCEKFGIESDDKVILVVARMDPIKGQDVAIKAMARIIKRLPDTKLVLIGNGSFSSARVGGLGLSKATRWLARLRRLAGELGIHNKVIFTNYVPAEELRAIYTRADLVVLPSVLEGFGMTILEGWLYKSQSSPAPGRVFQN